MINPFRMSNHFERVDRVGDPYRPGLHADPRSLLQRIVGHFAKPAVVQAVEFPVRGVDISSWQGVVNWEILKTKAQFAYIRAGVGNDTKDTYLDANRLGAASVDMPFGLYWYLKPDKSWQKTAESFAAHFLAGPGDLYPVLDCETTGGLNKSQLESWIYKCANYFETLTGVKITQDEIYTSPGFWNGSLPRTDWAKQHPLWVANWTSAANPLLPYDWQSATWLFWQWSADGNGQGAAHGVQSNSIDLDWYHYPISEFNARFGTHLQPPAPPPPPDPGENVMQWYVKATTTPHLNVRATPNGVDVGDLLPGVQFAVQDIVYAASGVWAQIAGGVYNGKWACLHNSGGRYCEPVGR